MRIMRLLLSAAVVAITMAPTLPVRGAPAERPTPRAAALAHLALSAEQLGLSSAEVAEVTVSSEVPTRHNGLTHVYLQQQVGGLEVVNAVTNIAIDRRGKVFHTASTFVPQVSSKAAGQVAAVTAEQALAVAATHLGIALHDRPANLVHEGGAAQASRWSGGSLSEDEIPARLKYLPRLDGEVLRLVWELVVRPPGGLHWWQLFVDATTGQVIEKFSWMAHDTYDVIPVPFEHPNESPQVTLTNPANPVASPFGWHDTNGAAGAEFTDTRGNNVFTQDDIDANNTGGTRPSGGAALDFNVVFDDTQDPPVGTNVNAAIINLFYMNNVMHDFAYHYGFDEPAGNFQENNYGNGGAQGDPVQADAQDGSGTNNANFGTPPDGSDPRMQMFVWRAPPNFTVNSPPPAAGTFLSAGAAFGPQPTMVGFTNDLVLVDDGVAAAGGGTINDGCETPFVNAAAVNGKIALIDRGLCEFGVKGVNAQTNNAIGLVVANNAPGDPFSMGAGAVGGSVTIPSLMIGQTDANTIKANLPANATINRVIPNRDSDFDNGIIAHEYGHGISNRLTGGPANVSCLQNTEQMGEGWSDFFALVTTAKATDTATTLRPIASYVAFSNAGIRPFPYTTDNTVNTHTYANVGAVAIPHGVGSIWNVMLWEMYWRLVDVYGFDPDLYVGNGGNNIAIQLVMDGMKLQPCSPGFVQGRDAILAADLANNCGRNRCLIWEAFAERGLGFSASQGSSGSVTDGTPAFDLPPECSIGWLFNDGFESGEGCAWTSCVGNGCPL